MRPTRATVEGRAYLDLQNKARKEKRPTEELFALYALEGFLTRLADSSYSDRLVLKGGVLLAAFDARRTTVTSTCRRRLSPTTSTLFSASSVRSPR